MTVSVLIPVYRNLPALALVLEAMRAQTRMPDEIVIAEDAQEESTAAFLADYADLPITHIRHEDLGNRKTVILNKAVCKATSDYLIFIDGDVIPYTHFVEYHTALAAPKRVLSGRRVNLDEAHTRRLLDGSLKAGTLERFYLLFALCFMFDRSFRYEQGFQLSPKGVVYRLFMKGRRRNVDIIGCNFSCYKADFKAINGFDESYLHSRLGDDTDLTWRFRAAGYTIGSVKNLANLFHLHHRKLARHPEADAEVVRLRAKRQSGEYYCEKGVSQYC